MQTQLDSLFLGCSPALQAEREQLLSLSKLSEREIRAILATADARTLRELNRQMEMLLEWKERRPIDFYEPAGKPQDEFHRCQHSLRVLFGANNSAKTTTIIGAEAVWWATGKHPYRGEVHGDGWIVSLDFPLSKTVAERKFFEWCPAEEIKAWHEKDRWVEMKNGNNLWFKSADSGRKKFQSARLRWCAMDEEIPKDIFEEIQARQTADQDIDIWMGLTPLEGMTWVWNELYEPWSDYQQYLKMAGTCA